MYNLNKCIVKSYKLSYTNITLLETKKNQLNQTATNSVKVTASNNPLG